jgi:hypothetical protein
MEPRDINVPGRSTSRSSRQPRQNKSPTLSNAVFDKSNTSTDDPDRKDAPITFNVGGSNTSRSFAQLLQNESPIFPNDVLDKSKRSTDDPCRRDSLTSPNVGGKVILPEIHAATAERAPHTLQHRL